VNETQLTAFLKQQINEKSLFLDVQTNTWSRSFKELWLSAQFFASRFEIVVPVRSSIPLPAAFFLLLSALFVYLSSSISPLASTPPPD
jgi:hypothetical protein